MEAKTRLLDQQPPSIQAAIALIVEKIEPQEIILFGSRARGDHRDNSDFDLVVKGGNSDPSLWAETRVTLSEEAITLFKIDLLKWDDLSEKYLKNISKEGKILYG